MIKFTVVFIWALAALLAQVTMQKFSLDSRDYQNAKSLGVILPGIAKVIAASGFSLFMAFICYRYLSFFQFLISQGLFYVMAFMYSFLVLQENLNSLKIASIVLFIPAVLLALI